MKRVIKNSWESVIEEEVNSQMKRKIIHGEKLMIVKMRFKDGFIVPMHSHINEQITQVNKGTPKTPKPQITLHLICMLLE